MIRNKLGLGNTTKRWLSRKCYVLGRKALQFLETLTNEEKAACSMLEGLLPASLDHCLLKI